MKISVIIPVYNEINTIQKILDKVKAIKLDKEIIIVDDYSQDGTRELLKNLKDDSIEILFHDSNKGKGSAIRTGIKYATGDIIIIQDADLEYDPEDYYDLVEPIEKDISSVVYGSRILGGRMMSYRRYYWGGRGLTWFTNFLYRTNITDMPTGYKVFRADVLKGVNLECKRFEFCPEVTAKILRRGYRIYEVPIAYHPRKFKEGKKLRWYDGILSVWTLIKYRFKKEGL